MSGKSSKNVKSFDRYHSGRSTIDSGGSPTDGFVTDNKKKIFKKLNKKLNLKTMYSHNSSSKSRMLKNSSSQQQISHETFLHDKLSLARPVAAPKPLSRAKKVQMLHNIKAPRTYAPLLSNTQFSEENMVKSQIANWE